MFTQSCFIRNVSKLLVRDIRVLGYEPMYDVWHYNVKGNNLVLENNTWHFTNSDNHPNSIDCGENEKLFISIASLRDDTDEFQWFVHKNGVDWWLCTDFDTFEEDYKTSNTNSNLSCKDFHKATVTELIEHFKTK